MISRNELLETKPLIISGPCSVASEKQILEIAIELESMGVKAIRCQLWKPRTMPESFQGIGEEGISWIKRVKKETSLIIVMEVTDKDQISKLKGVADVLWIGARNMQNFELLKAVGNDPRPVILKRGLISTMKEWIGAAHYTGIDKTILCERGIRTGADSTRFTLDINSALVAKYDHNMPVLTDPSHSAGRRDLIAPLSYASIAAGLDGLIIESHTNPDEELVDRDQTIDMRMLSEIISNVNKIRYSLNG
jgi:3-deoxy-7-phosphoheptulonate synthase